MEFICYKNCSTCKKAKAWLEHQGMSFTTREITEQIPTAKELEQWHMASGLPLRRFFNTSGRVYRENNLKDVLPTLSAEEQYQLLSSDGMLIRRPLLIASTTVLVGFRPEEWEKALEQLSATENKE